MASELPSLRVVSFGAAVHRRGGVSMSKTLNHDAVYYCRDGKLFIYENNEWRKMIYDPKTANWS